MQRLNPMIESCLTGYTSDHTFRGISANFTDQNKQLTLRGATWNMMNRAHDDKKLNAQGEPLGYSNNPFNVNETLEEYKARKLAQIKELAAILDSQNGKPLDFVFLQEVDWAQHCSGDELKVRQEIKQAIENFLRARGYAMIVTKHKKSDLPENMSQQALVTIYNTKTLTHVQSQGAFPLNGRRFRGYESQFIHIASSEKVALTNLHLDFNHDYTSEIDAYLADKVQKGEHTIMGGDTNHPQNEGVQQLIVDWHHASNVENDNGKLTDRDTRDANKKKAYDGFFAAPGGKNFAVKITEEMSKYFEVPSTGRGAYVKSFLPDEKNRHHFSERGRPWKRIRHLLKDLDNELGAEKDEVKAAQIFAELIDILQRRLPGITLESKECERLVNARRRVGIVSAPLPTLFQPQAAVHQTGAVSSTASYLTKR